MVFEAVGVPGVIGEAIGLARFRGRVVVVGLATYYCVKETVIDAIRARFATTVLADGIRAVNLEPGDGARAVAAMAAAGVAIE